MSSLICINFTFISSSFKKPNCTTQAKNTIWTFMFYMNGDTNIEYDMLKLFNDLEKGFRKDEGINIIALIDRNPNYDASLNNWTNTRLYQIDHDCNNAKINSLLLEDWDEREMDNSSTLSDFITYSIDNFPASHYMLAICNHGFGVKGTCIDETTSDDSSIFDVLTLDEIQQAINTSITDKIGKIDIIYLIACLMATLETAYELRNLADYLIASQKPLFGGNLKFHKTLNRIYKNRITTPLEIAESIVYSYEKRFSKPFIQILYDTTLSLVDLSAVSDIIEPFNSIFLQLSDLSNKSEITEFISVRSNTLDFEYDHMDLIHFLQNMRNNKILCNMYPELVLHVNRTLERLEEIIVSNFQDSSLEGNANGLSIYMPYPYTYSENSWVKAYSNLNYSFADIDFLNNSIWNTFLYHLYNDDDDADDLPNWFEFLYGLNPFNEDSNYNNINDAWEDLDMDEQFNLWELHDGTNPLLKDTDNDGLTDREEGYIKCPDNPGANQNGYLETLPYSADSDNDGFSDYDEIYRTNTDPNDSGSRPNYAYRGRIVFGIGLSILAAVIICYLGNKENEE